jgi:hypothetical protein
MQVTRVGDNLQVGGNLSPKQRQALEAAGITPAQILENLDGLSAEIAETYSQEVPLSTPVQRPTRPLPKAPPVQAPKSRVDQKAEEIQERIPDPEPEADLDQFLDKATQAARQDDVEPTFEEKVKQLLADTKGAPNAQQLEVWKAQYGDVYCFALGPGDVYVFTYLKRTQWQRISEVMKEFQAKGGVTGEKYEQQLKEKVVQNCVLFPKPLTPEFFVNSRAGVVDGIFEAIMFHSAFLAPQQVINLTVQL